MALDYDVFTSPTNELDALLRSADVLNVSADTTESSVISNSISSGLNLGNAVSGEELGAIICYAKSWFNDPVEGWMQGYDPSDAKYKWIIGSNVSSIDWGVSAAGTLTINGAGLVSPTLSYGKTSFSDSTHAGYWISDAGIYVGAAADASKLKYTVADGTFDFVGTISSRSTVTVASAINSSGNLVTDIINARIDSNAKTILAGFDFGTANYAGAVKTGDIAWNVTTGAITGGSGVVVYRNGIVGAAAGVTTFSIDATTGNATFAGSLSAPSGTIGGFTIGATALTATNLAITSGAANVANISVGTGSNLAGMNSGNAASDIAFWAGSTFANRATAPFRVDLSGQVTIQYGADYEADAAFYVLDNRNVANVPALDIVSVNGSCLSAASSANSEVVLITSTGFTGGTGSGILNVIGSENATGPAIRGEAKGESVIELKQRTAVSTNYYRTDRLIGDTSVNVSRFIANNVSPDGVLTGTKGSTCQSSNGKFYVNTDGATAWAELSSGGEGLGLVFGDGSDGDATIAAPTTLTRDMFYDDLTLSSTLNPNGYVINVAGTLTVNAGGQITSDGGAGGNGGDCKVIKSSASRHGSFTSGSKIVTRDIGESYSSLWSGQVITDSFGYVRTIDTVDSADQLTLTTNAAYTGSASFSMSPAQVGGTAGTAGSAGNALGTIVASSSGKVGTAGVSDTTSSPGTTGSNGGVSAVVTGNPGAGGQARNTTSSYSAGGYAGSLYSTYLNPITSLLQSRFIGSASVGSAGSGAGGAKWTTGGGTVDYGAGGGGAGSGGNGGFVFVYAKNIVLNGGSNVWLSAKGGNGGNGGIGDLGFIYPGITGVSGGGGGGGGVGGTAVVVYFSKTGSMTVSVTGGTGGTGGTGYGGLSENGYAGTSGAAGKSILIQI
jgi:hypothetical protein